MTDNPDKTGTMPDLTVTLIERLLDWPFLLFLLCIGIFVMARTELFTLLSRRQVTVKIGGNEVTIGDAIERLNNETDVTGADLEALQTQINALKAQRNQQPEENQAEAQNAGDNIANHQIHNRIQDDGPAPADTNHVIDRLRDSLQNHKYTWRSIKRLALEAGITEAEAHALLAGQPDIKIGLGKTGNTIARLIK